MSLLDFNQIYLGGTSVSQGYGKLRLAVPVGIGWKRSSDGHTIKLPATDFYKLNWRKCARGYQLRIQMRSGDVHKFDGFENEDFDNLSKFVYESYSKKLEKEDISLRGWNWGDVEFTGDQLSFAVSERILFEVPLKDVANTSLASKTEVSMRFNTELNDKKGEQGSGDALEEIRFLVPGIATHSQVDEKEDGTVMLKDKEDMEKDEEEEEVKVDDEENDENLVQNEEGDYITSAAVLLETIRQKSDIGEKMGESIASFSQILCVLPRGRFDVDYHTDFLVLRGKSRDHKVVFNAITKMFLLPNPNEVMYNLVIGLNPPLRQGQTKYPYLVFQFPKEEVVELTLVLEEQLLQTTYKDRLTSEYEGPCYQVFADVLAGLSGKKTIEPNLSEFKTTDEKAGFKCAHKANECIMFPLHDSLLVLFKPVDQISYRDISAITFPGNAGQSTTLKSFEIKISTRSGPEHTFTSIPREEYDTLLSFFKSKQIKVVIAKEHEQAPKGYYEGPEGMDLDDDDDSEENDDDFVADSSDSDVAEEYDEEASSASGSDSGSGSDSEDEKPKKKKVKK